MKLYNLLIGTNLVTGTLDVTGTNFGVVTSVTSIHKTTYYGDGSKPTVFLLTYGTENVSSNTTISGIITHQISSIHQHSQHQKEDALTVTRALIFNTTENKVQMYLGSEWKSLAFELDTYTSIGI